MRDIDAEIELLNNKLLRQEVKSRRAERLDIAKHAMQGLLALDRLTTKTHHNIAEHSVRYADALIAELDKTDE